MYSPRLDAVRYMYLRLRAARSSAPLGERRDFFQLPRGFSSDARRRRRARRLAERFHATGRALQNVVLLILVLVHLPLPLLLLQPALLRRELLHFGGRPILAGRSSVFLSAARRRHLKLHCRRRDSWRGRRLRRPAALRCRHHVCWTSRHRRHRLRPRLVALLFLFGLVPAAHELLA